MANTMINFTADIGIPKGRKIDLGDILSISEKLLILGDKKPGIADSAFNKGYVHVSAMIPGRDIQAIGHAFSGYAIKDRKLTIWEYNDSKKAPAMIQEAA